MGDLGGKIGGSLAATESPRRRFDGRVRRGQAHPTRGARRFDHRFFFIRELVVEPIRVDGLRARAPEQVAERSSRERPHGAEEPARRLRIRSSLDVRISSPRSRAPACVRREARAGRCSLAARRGGRRPRAERRNR